MEPHLERHISSGSARSDRERGPVTPVLRRQSSGLHAPIKSHEETAETSKASALQHWDRLKKHVHAGNCSHDPCSGAEHHEKRLPPKGSPRKNLKALAKKPTLQQKAVDWMMQMPAALIQPKNLDAPFPKEARSMVGKLANGMQYYVRSNSKPEQRVSLRLAVRTGSVHEEDDQQGLAHFLEHMAFNSTESFDKGEIASLMESIGSSFGAHTNALTTFDRTVYQLEVPVEDEELTNVRKALGIFKDWAGGGLKLLKEEVDMERGVVEQEWRDGFSANQRLFLMRLEKQWGGTRMAERLPIGKMEVIRNFELSRLAAFYKKHYRPELMAVVVVGDFGSNDRLLAMLNEFLGSIPRTPKSEFDADGVQFPVKRPGKTWPASISFTDKELPYNNIAVSLLYPDPETLDCPQTYRQGLVESLHDMCLSRRFDTLATPPDGSEGPFLAVVHDRSNDSGISKDWAELSLSVVPKNSKDAAKNGFERALEEVERVHLHGFLAAEVDLAKRKLMANLQTSYIERHETESDVFVESFLDHWLSKGKTSLASVATELKTQMALLKTVTAEEVSSFGKSKHRDLLRAERRLFINTYTIDDMALTEADMQAALESVKARSEAGGIGPWKELSKGLSASLEKLSEGAASNAGRAVSTCTVPTSRPGYEATHWTLSNGATVSILRTDLESDTINVAADAPGGLPDDRLEEFSLNTALSVVDGSGLADLSQPEVDDMLVGQLCHVSPSCGVKRRCLNGGSNKECFEALLQLLFVAWTRPRADSQQLKEIIEFSLEKMKLDQETYSFKRTQKVREVLDGPDALLITAEEFESLANTWSTDMFLELHKQFLGSPSEWSFVFTGALPDDTTVKTLIERYIGGLPAGEAGCKALPPKRWPTPLPEVTKPATYRMEISPEESAEVQLYYVCPEASKLLRPSMSDELLPPIVFIVAGQVVQQALTACLRLELGSAYSPSASCSADSDEILGSQGTDGVGYLQWSCNPQDVQSTVRAAKNMLAQLIAKGPAAKEVASAKKQIEKSTENLFQENSFWRSALADSLLVARCRPAAAASNWWHPNYVLPTPPPESMASAAALEEASLKSATVYRTRLADSARLKEELSSITKERVHEAIRRTFKASRAVEISVLPTKEVQAAMKEAIAAKQSKKPRKLRKPKFVKVRTIEPESRGLNLYLKVMSSTPLGGTSELSEVYCGDDTGSVTITARGEQSELLKVGSSIIVRNAHVRMINGHIRVVVDKWGKLEIAPEEHSFAVKEKPNVSGVEYELSGK